MGAPVTNLLLTLFIQFHNYVTRLSPHLLNYPSFTPKSEPTSSTEPNGVVGTGITSDAATEPTDLDIALRALITNLKPFNLTKAEVLTIINLGVGLDTSTQGEGQVEEGAPDAAATTTEAGGDDDTIMQDGNAANGEVPVGEANGEGEEEMGEAEDGDYGALALLDTVIEDREERLSNEDVSEILRIVRETLGKK